MDIKANNTKKIILAFAFLIICSAIEYFININLYKVYPNLTISPDFLFSHTPYVNILWLADAILVLSNILFIIFIFSDKKFKELPFYAVIIGVYNLIRGLLIYATPLANPAPNPGGLNLPLLVNGGMFPSGHVGAIFLFFLFTLNSKSKKWRAIFIILLIAEIISMVLSRGHYTIDIVGALFISYALWKVGGEHFKSKLILK